MKNQEELQTATQTVGNGDSTVQEGASSYESIKARLAKKANEDAQAILPKRVRVVKAGGSGKTYNHDQSRTVKAYDAKGGSKELCLVKRTDKDTGVFISNFRAIESGFELLFHRHKASDQVTLFLNNGKELIGHIVMNKGLRGFYFPKRNCEGIELPSGTEEEQPIVVLSILVG